MAHNRERRHSKNWLALLYALSPNYCGNKIFPRFKVFFTIGRIINSFSRFWNISKIQSKKKFNAWLHFIIPHIWYYVEHKKSEFKRGWKYVSFEIRDDCNRWFQIILILKINLFFISFSLKYLWFLRKFILNFFFPSRLSIKMNVLSKSMQWSPGNQDCELYTQRLLWRIPSDKLCDAQGLEEASPATSMFKPVARLIQYFICFALDKVKIEKWLAPFFLLDSFGLNWSVNSVA